MMDDSKVKNNGEDARTGRSPHRRYGRLVRGFLCLIILIAGIAGASYITKTAPKAGKRPPSKEAPLVRVEEFSLSLETVTIRAMGTVIPARQVLLKSRLSGEVIETHPEFTEGGLLQKGAVVLQLDPQDYKLAVTQKQTQVVNAQYQLELELGKQEVAKREWRLLNRNIAGEKQDADLALRKPHLEKARADLAAAQAELSQALLDLSRTTILAPFNSVVREKNVEVGSQVSAQGLLAGLVCTDSYWVRVDVPLDRLKWINIPLRSGNQGSMVRIFCDNGPGSACARTGNVIRILSDLEVEGRMARLLVSVKDPLCLKKENAQRAPVLLGDYLRVEIQGHEIKDVYRIPRTALRDNSKIWVAAHDGTLHIREVHTVWRDIDTVLIRDGLRPGDRLIISDLQSPVEGMRIRLSNTAGKGFSPQSS